MHAVVLHAFGPAENLSYETVPDPEPGPGQVRIAVKAAGVHLVETMLRAGRASDSLPPQPELPTIFGGEVSGRVDAVGPDVDPEWIGRDVVTAGGQPGGYAELAVADLSRVHRLPDGLSHEAAVAMIVTGGTTLQFLDVAQPTPSDVLLVTSAAGGIGRLIVQYARRLGATVIGAAGGPGKVAAVRELGADFAVDYDLPSWPEEVASWLGGRKVTALLDGVGGDKARAAFGLLADGGRYVTIGNASQGDFTPDPETVRERGLTVTNALLQLIAQPETRPEYEVRALAAAAEGALVPDVQTFPLSQAAAAHAALESRQTTGKVVLIP
ncbi:putative oxidoreductase [[Actinomadura] parvosata subsp. kistnae]|uniref:NADPH quinone oxidoreductase n=1 Tax=[Actinomadura] parvosata subsp. kistnae TaxID=1909395 RepID=A0A1V0AFN6_9ACTN|nr:zinc-binding dehydrogenase [Nonomuraea sp. ATCC 55076]AQZ69051.1 NADPH quinone oxidoreductase [Nonomuraea sp. ATCC 55076]SPL92376.1 putative oxidoreductase [Actinomadura parvosata subsp. kistnae]